MYWHIDSDIIALIVIFFLSIYNAQMNRDDTLRNKRFSLCLKMGIVVSVVDIAASLVMDLSAPPLVFHTLMSLYFICIESVIVVWLYYAMAIVYSDDSMLRKKLSYAVFIPFVLYSLLVCSNPWSGLLYTLTKDGAYNRGPLFFIMVVLYVVYIISLLMMILLRKSHIPSGYPTQVLALIPIIVSISIVVQLIVPGWLTIMPGYMLCLLLAVLFLQRVRYRNERDQMLQLADLIDHLSAGIIINHIDENNEFKTEYISKTFYAICEIEPEEQPEPGSFNLVESIYPQDAHFVEDTVKKLIAGEDNCEVEYRIVTEKGNLRWVNAKTTVSKQPDGTSLCYSTFIDLTEYKKRQQQMFDVIHTVPCGICLYEWTGDDLYPLLVNNRFSEMLGENAFTYLKGVKSLNYTHVHPDDLENLRKASYDALKDTGHIDYTYRSLNFKTNEYIWIRMQGNMVVQPDGAQYAYMSYYDVTQEHKLMQRLKESEQTLEFAVKYAGLWNWRYDVKNNKVYSDQENVFGISNEMDDYPESWLSQGFVEDSCIHIYRNAVEQIKQGVKQVSFEAQVYMLDKKLHWARFSFTNMFDDDGKVATAVCTARVIDDEKELEAKYELERKRIIMDDDNLIVYALFNLTTGETMEYNYAPGYMSGVNVPQEDRTAFNFGQKNVDLLIDEQERKEFLALNNTENLLRSFRQGKTDFKLEYRRRQSNGEIIWVRNAMHMVRDPSSRDVLLFDYWYDIEEEKIQEIMYRSISTSTYDYVARIYGKTRRFVVVPQKGLTYKMPPLKGDDADDVTKTLYEDGIHEEDRTLVIKNFIVDNMLHNIRKYGRYQFTYREIQPDGSMLYKNVTQYFIDEQREIIVATREDITDTIKSETERNDVLASALDVAHQASDAKSQFLSRVSHELRTPLNAIIGFLELSKDADEEQKKSYLKNSDTAAKQLLSIINDVLDMSSIEAGKMKLSYLPFDFKQLIHSITNMYITQCEQKGLVFETQILTPVDEWLIGDKMRVNQILINLIGNAMKFTSEGYVRLRISQTGSLEDKVYMRFEVSDTGCGISDEMKKRLFKPFEQGNAVMAQKYGGSGLGLSIVSSLVNLMKGAIRVDSTMGLGSSFTVDIPFTKCEDEIKTHGLAEGEKLRVLAVDDEFAERNYISTVLGRMNIDHTCVESGQAAEEEFARAMDEDETGYNVCIIDWRMPGDDGVATTKRLREKYGPELVVIVISAYEQYMADESAKAAGADMFISKPLFQSTLFDLFMNITGGNVTEQKTVNNTMEFSDKRILLAEDNLMNRMVAEGIMARMGIVCDSAENGQVAANMFLESGKGYYDAILMDIQMPVMDGFDSTKMIRQSNHPDAKDIHIIALTANAFKEDMSKSLSCGMNDHIAKPIEPKLLAEALERAFSHR